MTMPLQNGYWNIIGGNNMLIDLHAHSSGISKCCRIPYAEVLDRAAAAGLDGIVLTNHYQNSYVCDGKLMEFVENYIAEYEAAAACGAEKGIHVFFGIEVTMELYRNVHMLIYGVDPVFLRTCPTVFDCTEEALYALVKAHGGVLVQAHPFRNGTTVLDPAYLDGIEINCHPKYKTTEKERLTAIAAEHGLLLTCGGDYHADTYRPICGTYVPDTVTDGISLGRFLAETNRIRLRIHEVGAENWYEEEFMLNV